MKYHDLFVIFEKKAAKFEIVVCCKLNVALYEIILSGTRGIGPYRICAKMHMLTYFTGLQVFWKFYFIWDTLFFHTLCSREATALSILHVSAG